MILIRVGVIYIPILIIIKFVTTAKRLRRKHNPPFLPNSSKNTSPFFTFLGITGITLVAWFLTKKFLKPLNFRLFWNLILLASFLPVGISGILLFLNIQISNFAFWHNFLGVIFVVVGLLHLLARLNYFKQALGNKIKTD